MKPFIPEHPQAQTVHEAIQYVCIYTCTMYIHTHTYVHIYIYIYTYTYIYIYTYTYIYIYIYTQVSAHMYLHIFDPKDLEVCGPPTWIPNMHKAGGFVGLRYVRT